MSRVTDYSEQFMRDLAKAVDDGLRQASFLASDLASASMPGAGARVVGTTGTGRNLYNPSATGQPPGVRTARLKNSIASERLQPGVWGFGTGVRYGRFLETGTSRMESRPFIGPVPLKHRGQIQRAFAQSAGSSLARSTTARAVSAARGING